MVSLKKLHELLFFEFLQVAIFAPQPAFLGHLSQCRY